MAEGAPFDERLAAISDDRSRSRLTLRLQPEFEREYEARTASKRERAVRQWHVAAMLANIACLPLDYSADLLTLGLILRLMVVTPLYLAGLLFLGRGPQWLRSAAAIVPLVAFAVSAVLIGQTAVEPHSDRYMMATGLLILFANIAVPFTLPQATVVTLASIIAMLAIVLGKPQVSQDVFALSSFIAAITLFSLLVRFQSERSSRNAFLIGLRDEIKSARLVALTEALTQLAETDPLTGLYNRRHLAQRLREKWEEASGHGDWIGVLMIDIDHFKRFNDTAGHEEGDRCLKAVAGVLKRETASAGQYVARFGGEEFMAVLHGMEPDPAMQQAERLRRSIEEMDVAHPGLPEGSCVTVSIGASVLIPSPQSDVAELVAAADKALYEAKANGRNCVAAAAAVRLPATEVRERVLRVVGDDPDWLGGEDLASGTKRSGTEG
ncbi:MAG: GGDEF domain-containing protein [Rhizobiaceae bacterium]